MRLTIVGTHAELQELSATLFNRSGIGWICSLCVRYTVCIESLYNFLRCRKWVMLLKKQTKKMIAPIVITVIVISYFMFYIWLGFAESGDIPLLMKILLIVVPSGLIVLMVYLLFERVNEIKEDDDDDLSKY